ncbi:MAG TPA: rod shape-determining protein MreD [Flavobacterium sp.]
MNSAVIINIIRFILLLAAQVIIFSNMNFAGFISPFPYILFIILYPVDANKLGLLGAAFALGIIMDMFSNSGGVHAASCLVLAYVRPSIFKFSFGLSYEYQTIRINDVLTPERFSFILISVVIHHFVLFVLEVFRISYIWDILLRTIFSTIFTIILSIILIYLFKPSKR